VSIFDRKVKDSANRRKSKINFDLFLFLSIFAPANMTIQDLVQLYGQAPQVETLRKTIGEKSVKTIFLDGLVASSAPLLLSAVITRQSKAHSLIILNDEEEAGYFYQDLKQVLGDGQVLFFPSSFRRAIKYAQRDAANEILRTEVLTSLASHLSPLTSHLRTLTSHLSPLTSSLLRTRKPLLSKSFPQSS